MTRKIIGVDGGFMALEAPYFACGKYTLTIVADDERGNDSLSAPARVLQVQATQAQMRQIAEAVIATLEGEGAKS